MDLYGAYESGTGDNYPIQGMESANHLGAQFSDTVEAMYTDGTQEYVFDQGLYYPAATNYGYYSTGFESPVEWEDHHPRFFGVDGLDVQYVGAQTESLPYVYYTPNYGFVQSQYNPYSPCIPGAMVGVDGSFLGTQQYYTIPAYQNAASPPAYVPVIAHSGPEIIPGGSSDMIAGGGVSIGNVASHHNMNNYTSSGSSSLQPTSQGPFFGQTQSFTRVHDGSRANVTSGRQSANNPSYPTTESHNLQHHRHALGPSQESGSISNGRVQLVSSQQRSAPLNNGFCDLPSRQMSVDQLRPRVDSASTSNVGNGSSDALGEQNRGPRINKLRNQLSLKLFSTNIGDSNAQGNIIIYKDRYNKNDFPVDYFNAKFFVIKSYSEDDVHKSIKYNVWSSTPNGNRKLNSGYEDARRRALEDKTHCPIFLFFSVNASGQFCGVAEMIGPVDFYKDMDFWQQDKWTGSFPVKWHFIKDVPNTSFRHILLENNEHKPVTNSRDTQEVMFRKGLEMLRVFKNYVLRTCLLDDFKYYEDRQKLMHEEKAKLLMKNYPGQFSTGGSYRGGIVSSLPPAVAEDGKDEHDNGNKSHDSLELEKQGSSDSQAENFDSEEGAGCSSTRAEEDDLKMESLKIHPEKDEKKPHPAFDVVTVGSMQVIINGQTDIKVGTIPLHPRALQNDKDKSKSSK